MMCDPFSGEHKSERTVGNCEICPFLEVVPQKEMMEFEVKSCGIKVLGSPCVRGAQELCESRGGRPPPST